jgi:hypothetical protein
VREENPINICNRVSWASLLIISVIAIIFGCWFAKMQVSVVAPGAIDFYPKQYYVLTVIKCYFTTIAFWLFVNFVSSFLTKCNLNLRATALNFMPLVLVWLKFPLLCVVGTIFFLQFLYLISVLTTEDYKRFWNFYAIDALVLFVFFVCHLLLTSSFSPLHWSMSMLTAVGYYSEEIPVLAPVFKGFLLAKQFSFSNIDHAEWACIMHPAASFVSPFMQLLTLILDLPSVSYEAFHKFMMTIYFILIVLGSFGFYLFLKYAAKVSSLFAFFGGYIFCFSGAPLFLQSFFKDGGIFLPAQAVFPYALLLISVAFEKNNKIFAAWAGLALASQFFILTPHPEATIYSILFYGIYTFGLCMFSWELPKSNRWQLAILSGITFSLLSAFYISPILIDKMNGELFVFAHVGDVTFNTANMFQKYINLLAIFVPISLVLLYLNKKISPVYLSSLLLSIFLFLIVLLSMHQSFNDALAKTLHIGLHLWIESRVGVYFYVSTFIIAIFGLDILSRNIANLLIKCCPSIVKSNV